MLMDRNVHGGPPAGRHRIILTALTAACNTETGPTAPVMERGPCFFGLRVLLDYRDIGRRRPFLPLLHVEGHAIALFERTKTGRIDRRMMHEDIRAVFLLDEAITFLVIKPFDNAIRHGDTPFLKKIHRFLLQAATGSNGEKRPKGTGPPSSELNVAGHDDVGNFSNFKKVMQVDSAPSQWPDRPTGHGQASRLPQAGLRGVANHLKFEPQPGVSAAKQHASPPGGTTLGKPAICTVDPVPARP
jgi:hypothetical protein